MPRTIERQTLIALKARHTAFRVVSDFLHFGRIDPTDIACSRCGRAMIDVPGDVSRLCSRCLEQELRWQPSEELAPLIRTRPFTRWRMLMWIGIAGVGLAIFLQIMIWGQ